MRFAPVTPWFVSLHPVECASVARALVVCDEIIVMKDGHKVTQVARADYDKPSSERYDECLKQAVPELRQGWLEEHESLPADVLRAE